MVRKLKQCSAWMAVVVLGFCATARAEVAWHQEKSKHFKIFYTFEQDRAAAKKILRKAEYYYDRIADDIGYARYANFWTWDERVKILVFPDQDSFMRNTGQPAWSIGYAMRDSSLFKSRVIVTYRHEFDFLEGLLPHEISHLMLRDFIGFDRDIPVWFDEGVAQLYESKKKKEAYTIMGTLVAQGSYVPFETLQNWNIYREDDPQLVTVFYAQSVTIVDFLIRKYGSAAFGRLCRGLKEGKTMDQALRAAYTNIIDSMTELEEKWLRHMRR